jgi:hypothetical protein
LPLREQSEYHSRHVVPFEEPFSVGACLDIEQLGRFHVEANGRGGKYLDQCSVGGLGVGGGLRFAYPVYVHDARGKLGPLGHFGVSAQASAVIFIPATVTKQPGGNTSGENASQGSIKSRPVRKSNISLAEKTVRSR